MRPSLSTQIDRLRSRVANARASHRNSEALQAKLQAAVVKQLRAEIREDRRLDLK